MNHVLRITNWNANSVQNKKLDIINFINTHNLDIMMITETFLKPGIKFSIPNYRVYRLDRETGPKGGVAIVIKASIKHKIMKSMNLKVIEALGIIVETQYGTVTLISAYHPGSNKNMRAFTNDIIALTRIKTSYFLCGDFNARHRQWNCVQSNEAGKVLFDKLQTVLFSIHHPNTPTYIPCDHNRTPSTLDIIISNNINQISTPQTITSLTSDHLPVAFEILNTKPTANLNHFIWDYKTANWQNFSHYINCKIDLSMLDITNINNPHQIDNMVTSFTSIVQDARNISVPKITPGLYNIIIPQEIKKPYQVSKQVST